MGKGKPWDDAELSALTRAHAEGKYNHEIYPLIPKRSWRSIDVKMIAMGLERNRMPSRENWGVRYAPEPSIDRWHIKVKFEDVTMTEARQISAGSPISAPFRKHNEHRSIYGSSMADMVA